MCLWVCVCVYHTVCMDLGHKPMWKLICGSQFKTLKFFPFGQCYQWNSRIYFILFVYVPCTLPLQGVVGGRRVFLPCLHPYSLSTKASFPLSPLLPFKCFITFFWHYCNCYFVPWSPSLSPSLFYTAIRVIFLKNKMDMIIVQTEKKHVAHKELHNL